MLKKDYVLLLNKISLSKDPYLLKKTITSNKKMDINEFEIFRLVEKIKKIEYLKLDIEHRLFNIMKIEQKYSKDFSEYLEDISAGITTSKTSTENIKAKLYENSDASEIDKEEDSILFDEKIYEIFVFSYEIVNILTTGGYFGENGNNSPERKRSQFIRSAQDTICLSFSNDIYQKYILLEFQKLKNQEISFLNDNSIFSNIKRGTFLNHYFKYFKIEEFSRGEKIFVEEQKVDKIFLIKEGRIEINIFSNLINLHTYTNELININTEIHHLFKEDLEIPKLSNQPKNYMESLKKNKNYSIFLLQENDMLGIEEVFYNFKRLYRATVASDKLYVYSIPVNKLLKIIDFEPKIQSDYKNYSFRKICNLIKRLVRIKNSSLTFIDKKYSYDNTKRENSDVLLVKKKEREKYLNKSKSPEDLRKDIENYYRNYKNKHSEKKYELLLNPKNDEFQFYKNFNYEDNKIKNLKLSINKLKSGSIENILPNIYQNYTNMEQSCNIIKGNSVHSLPTIVETQENSNLIKISLSQTNLFMTNILTKKNSVILQNNVIYNNTEDTVETIEHENVPNINTIEDEVNKLYGNKNKFVYEDDSPPRQVKNNKIFKDKIEEEKFECFNSTNEILAQGSLFKINKLKRVNGNNYNNSAMKNGNVNSSIKIVNKYAVGDDREGKVEEEEKKLNCFIPYAVDNSIKGIRNFHKKIQMLMPKKYNFVVNNHE